MDIDLNDYAAGGYVITRCTKRTYNSEELVPEWLINLSLCRGNSAYLYWGNNIAEYEKSALHFGIPTDKLPALKAWAINDDEGFHNVFYTLEAARRYIAAFELTGDDLVLVGIGLHASLLDQFLTYNQPASPDKPYRVCRVLKEGKPLPPGGEILGFDVVTSENVFGCSWLCLALEYHMDEEYGIRAGPYGLFRTFEEAKATECVKGLNQLRSNI